MFGRPTFAPADLPRVVNGPHMPGFNPKKLPPINVFRGSGKAT
jgi:hypothetical protein